MPSMFGNMEFEEICNMIQNFAPSMNDYLYVYDFKADRFYVSERAEMRFALPSHSFSNLFEYGHFFVYREDLLEVSKDIKALIYGKKNEFRRKCRFITKQNRAVWVHVRGDVCFNDEGERKFLVGCINEIGIKAQADNVSGLLDINEIRKTIARYEGPITKGFLLRIGIDDFREVNEKFGMEYGDFVLREVANVIKAELYRYQKLFHAGADEFIIADFESPDAGSAVDLYHRIREKVDELIVKNRYEAVYTISGGAVSIAIMDDLNLAKVEKYTQFAMNEAKVRGRNQVYVFSQDDYEAFIRRNELLRSLKESVARDCTGFAMHFQPIVDQSGNLFGAEGLLRYTTQQGEAISPAEFVPILEDSGLIIPVGAWIVTQGVMMAAACKKLNVNITVSINLSYIQLLKSPITDVIINTIEKYEINPKNLVVELTESGYLENIPTVQRVWNNLKEYGVRIAIDDFGTGYSNFKNITIMKPDVLKLDRSFTVSASTNEDAYKLMNQIVYMAHQIGLKVCVEGVETPDELETAQGVQADLIQGFYYGHPLEPRNFIDRFIL